MKLQYRGTFLGFLWNILEPLLMFVLLYVVFTNIRETTEENFAIYLISGIIFYHLFIKATSSGLISLKVNASILQSLNVNKEIFPVVSTGTIIFLMCFELLVFFGLMPVFNFVPSYTIIFLPVVIILFFILVLGASYFLSILYVYVKDIQQIWGIFSYSLLFVSPIFWSVDKSSGILLTLYNINPLGQIIELNHKIVFGQIPLFYEWLTTTIYVLIIFFSGFILFKKLENKVVEKL